MLSGLHHKVLVEFNGRRMPYPTDRTIIHLIEDQARKEPDRPALVWAGKSLSYGELLHAAAAWAGKLRAAGVTHGDFLPVVADGGPGLAVAVLAAMKLGAPFVIIDEEWPTQRIDAGIGQLRAPVVVSAGGWHDARYRVQRIDAAAAPPAAHPPVAHAVPSVEDVIYGFFTSGSTGSPKCALNLHRGLLNRFLVMTRRFGGDDVVLQNSRHVFDSSLWQLLWPLTKGSQVVLPRRDDILDLRRTVDEIARHGVTMTDFVPSVFNALVDLLTADPSLACRLASLRRLLIGGEEINPRAVQTFRGLLPQVTIINTFGPTECSIGSVFYEVTDADVDSIPIGRPIDNTYVAILDEHGEPVPPGQVGEIYIGGDCVGGGYLGDPRRTAAAFVPNHLPQIPGRILYRSGDLGCHRPDGELVFMGRRDQQIKVGGVRLELLEIETVIAAHPAVREVRCVIHETGDGKGVTCCVLARAAVTSDELAAHARQLLPGYALPRRFLFMHEFPLTPNGKVDRQELRRLAATLHSPAAAGPLSPRERAVRDIWVDLLAVDIATVGPDHDFYSLGGTSLTLQRLAAALLRDFGIRLPLRRLAAAATLREQAALLSQDALGPMSPAPDTALLADIDAAEEITRGRALDVSPAAPRRVLLTGATGFVGMHILGELLERTDTTVHCLVRAPDAAAARRRLEQALGRLGVAYDPDRVIAMPGELGKERLGQDDARWTRLAKEIDAIVHAGAQVNLLLGYRKLRGPNVMGTAEMLRLAVAERPKPLHHISTVSIFPETEGAGPVLEEDDLWDVLPADGYSQSKWAAEKILYNARAHGMPAAIYRLGQVMPHSRIGYGNPRSVLDLLLRACLRLGLRFRTDAVTDWTVVDDVARVIATALFCADARNETLHLLRPGPVPLTAMLDALAAKTPLREVGYGDFHRAVKESAERGDPTCVDLRAVLPDPAAENAGELGELFGDATAMFSGKRAAELAATGGRGWTVVDEGVLGAYAGTLKLTG